MPKKEFEIGSHLLRGSIKHFNGIENGTG